MLHLTWLLCVSAMVVARDASYPRTQWPYHSQKYRPQDGYVSHAYSTENTSELPSYSPSSQEYWRLNLSNITSYSPSKPYFPTAGGGSYQDAIRGSYSTYQYQQLRPKGQYPVKKIPTYYKEKYPDTFGKPKYKKTILYQSPTTYKKVVYPRVHKPYAKNKYPTQMSVHPVSRRYYQSPYQQYAISSNDILRYRDGYYKPSTASTPAYYTTERMDEQSGTLADDYYTDAYNKSSGSYYESYEEVERTTAEPEESSLEEATTRGYYGDRIYMSTQVPVLASDKIPIKNKYYLIRRTSDNDDIETIFE